MKKYLALAISIFLVLGISIAGAVISSYGSVTGYATVQQSITWDIIETGSDVNNTGTNDTVYVLEKSYQGETKWVKIKIKNAADVAIPVNLSVSLVDGSVGNGDDVELSITDETKNNTLSNPISVPTDDLYVWIKHYFKPTAQTGQYSFSVDILPT